MGDCLILAYHALSPTWPASLSTEPERLDAQLGTLAEMGYEGATFTQAVTAPPGRRTLAVTFDDGFHSVIDHGLPILSRHGFVGTVFVPTDHIGQDEHCSIGRTSTAGSEDRMSTSCGRCHGPSSACS